MGAVHQERIMSNWVRQQRALERKQMIEDMGHEERVGKLDRWAAYREKKIDLTANYVRCLKRKNRVTQLVRQLCLQKVLWRMRQNFKGRKKLLEIQLARIFLAIKFKHSFRR